MISEFIYLATVLLILGFLMYSSVYLIFLSYSWFKGAPYVATEQDEISTVLRSVGLKKGTYFYDLGCGDGRILRQAVTQYNVHGVGIDINAMLIMLAKIRSIFLPKGSINFYCQNILATDLTQADTIYMYLLPKMISRLEHKLKNELKKETIIISYAFKIPYFEDSLINQYKGPIFSTYFYKI